MKTEGNEKEKIENLITSKIKKKRKRKRRKTVIHGLNKDKDNDFINNNNIQKIRTRNKNNSSRLKIVGQRKINQININNNDKIIQDIDNSKIINADKKEPESEKNILTLNNQNNEINLIQELKNPNEFTDDEINDLSYDLAIKYDKRTYCQYYISLLKTKHDLIFSFIYNKDYYNHKIIKINLFFINFTINYTVNTLFYTDNTMHEIYKDKGTFDFIYQLPQIIYSALISIILITLLKMLALSHNDILKLKQDKLKDNIKQKGFNLNKKIMNKILIYFIFCFILLLFIWYYLSIFCAIYKNTQFHLMKETLISFGLSLLYPFGIFLLPGLLRIPALSDPNKNKNYLYNFSKILQVF